MGLVLDSSIILARFRLPLLPRFLAELASLFPPLGVAAVVVDSLSFRFRFSAGFLPGDEGAAAEVAGV